MSTQSAMLALLSLSSRRSAANRDELVSASAYAFHNDEDEVDGNNHQHQMIPKFMMRSQSHTLLARLLEKRRALEAEGNDADVGVLSSRNDTSSPDNSTTVPTTPNSSASYNASSPVIPEPTSGADAVDVAVSSGSSSYGVTMGSMLSEELVDKCLEKCPDSKLCTCLGDNPPYECYVDTVSFCEDAACMPENEAALMEMYFCPAKKCIASIDGIREMFASSYGNNTNTGSSEYDGSSYEQISMTMRACTYCVGRKSLCSACKKDDAFCNTVFQTSFSCEGVNCTLTPVNVQLVGDVCDQSYFYGQFINCEDYPDLSVSNYANVGGDLASNVGEEDLAIEGGSSLASSSSRTVTVFASTAALALISVGFSQ